MTLHETLRMENTMSTEQSSPTDARLEPRVAAFIAWVGVDLVDEDCVFPETYDECEIDGHLVLTDAEADERARDYIEQSLWAFNAAWIACYLPDGVGAEVVEALQPQCEGANDAMRSMVGDRFDELVSDAIAEDGRAHFLNTYDGMEHEFAHGGVTWYVYRVS